MCAIHISVCRVRCCRVPIAIGAFYKQTLWILQYFLSPESRLSPQAASDNEAELDAGEAHALERLATLIRRLKPLDRQIIVSYLEGMDATSIGEITGLSAGNISMKIHRIKETLKRWFHKGGLHAK